MSIPLSPSDGAVLITGTSSGIGFETAVSLANQGWLVFAGVEKLTQAEALFERIEDRENLVPVVMDVTDEAQVKAGAALVEKHLASLSTDAPRTRKPHLVTIINNAGVSGDGGPAEALSIESFERTMNVDFYGPIRVTSAFLPLLRLSPHGGRIINLSSLAALMCPPFMSIYTASKCALEAYSNALRWELQMTGQEKITVTCLRPGSIDTQLWPQALSEERLMAGIRKLDGTRMEYYFGDKFAGVLKKMIDRPGMPPSVVTDKIVDILRKGSSAHEVPVGPDSVAMHFVRRWFPEWVYNWLIGREMAKMLNE